MAQIYRLITTASLQHGRVSIYIFLLINTSSCDFARYLFDVRTGRMEEPMIIVKISCKSERKKYRCCRVAAVVIDENSKFSGLSGIEYAKEEGEPIFACDIKKDIFGRKISRVSGFVAFGNRLNHAAFMNLVN